MNGFPPILHSTYTMIKLFYFVLLLSQFPFSLSSQNHDHIWLFGTSDQPPPHSDARVDFNFDPPLVTHDPRPMVFRHTCSVFADEYGELLFASNGKWIASHNHELMENGDGLNPGDFADSYGDSSVNTVQGTLALPVPGQDGKYYLLHSSKDIYFDPLNFITFAMLHSTIDMEQNNGLGKVTEKNELLISDSLWVGMLTAVRHANGRDWWVPVRRWGVTNEYYILLVSPQGISVADTQMVGTPVKDGLGQAVFSPDGNKYVVVNAEGPTNLQVFDFDRCTGKLSNETLLHFEHWIGSPGIAISPNSRFLYFSATDTLYQYDLWASDIPASEVVVGEWDGNIDPFANLFFMAQLGPDGKIYINIPNGSNYLHVVNRPNEKGLACNFVQRGLDLMNRNDTALPNNPNYRLGPLDGSPCDTLGIDNVPVARFRYDQDSVDYLSFEFTDLSYYEPTDWNWDFGDNTTSQDTSPVHVFPANGYYYVCLTVSNGNGQDTFCRVIFTGTTANDISKKPQTSILVYPNPASGQVIFDNSHTNEKITRVVFYNNMGENIFENKWKGNLTQNKMDLSGLSPGIYFYTIYGEENILKSGKIIIQK